MEEEKKDFFRFYRKDVRDNENKLIEKGDGFEETEAAYKNIIIALAKAGKLKKVITKEVEVTYENGEKETVQKPVPGPNGELQYREDFAVYKEDGTLDEEATFAKVIAECKKIDDDAEKSGKIKEDKIGLRGFFTELGYTEAGFGKDELEASFKEIGDDALKQLPDLEDALEKFAKAREEILGDKSLSEDDKETKLAELDDEMRPLIESYAFLGELAAGPYFPRTTCFSASHFMSTGHIMQIGCSQGKTSVVAMTTYIQMKLGKQVFSTSSAPGLVPENYNEAKAFYEKMGIEEQFCSISQNIDDKEEHIVIFHSPEKRKSQGKTSNKYEIKEGGTVVVDTTVSVEKDGKLQEERKSYKIEPDGKIFTIEEYEEDGKKKERWVELEEPDAEILEEIGYTSGLREFYEELGLEVEDEKYDFKKSIKKMMAEKGIIMGDTITLGKYQDLMPKRNENGVIDNSFLIVDEADAELLDTFSQEILGDAYGKEIATKRWQLRKAARDYIKEYTGEPSGLEAYAKEKGVPLDFIVDAYEAKSFEGKDEKGNPTKYQIKDGKVFVLNLHTNVMIPASQGLAQAILANEYGNEEQSPIAEMEVLGETNIPELFSNFKIASLMSGTMEDKGMSKYSDPKQREIYAAARKEFLKKCGKGVELSAEEGVIDWRLITPQTREEKGDVVVSVDGIDRDENRKPPIQTIKQDIDIGNYECMTDSGEKLTGWRAYLADNGKALEDNWRKAVAEEANTRSAAGQPVMISMYGKRNPMPEGVPLYTDTNQIGSKENGTDDHKIGDDTCMFVNEVVDEKGAVHKVGEIACFDDFYGRGYTFKFLEREIKEDGQLGVRTQKNKEGKDKPVKVDKGGHVLITALPENSRNLEQFLFRVARGGAKGSSSIIISPNDPTLVKYLEEIEQKEPPEGGPEKANEYFQGVINGTIPIMKMVADIYPEATMKIFKDKVDQMYAIQEYQDQLNMGIEQIETIGQVGGRDNTALLENYKKRFNKEMVKRNKLNRQVGVDKETLLEQRKEMMFSAIDEMIKNGEIENVADFASILPVGLSEKYLEEIIPDENKRKQVIETIEKIQNYVDRRKTIEKQVEKKMEREEKDGENTEQRRDTINEIVEATLESEGYNLTEVKSALDVLREIKLPNRDQNREQDGVEK